MIYRPSAIKLELLAIDITWQEVYIISLDIYIYNNDNDNDNGDNY